MRQRVLHTVTVDPDQVLKDDGLRILRAARFQAELGFMPSTALLCSAAKYAPLLNDIAPERLRDELTKLLLSDAKYPTLHRNVPPIAAGLATLCRTGSWPYLFGALVPNETAIAATSFYHAPDGLPPISGKLALLFFNEQPASLAERMTLLRYSVRETEAAIAALTAMRGIDSGSITLMDAVRMGMVPVSHAEAALKAFSQAGETGNVALEKASALRLALQDESVPKRLKDLAIRGDDLLPLCRRLNCPVKAIGPTLDTLWQSVVEKQVPNERSRLLSHAETLLSIAPPH